MTSAISSYLYSYDSIYQQQINNLMSLRIRQYEGYLQEQYPYVNSDDTLVGGIPTRVNVSLEYIKKCMEDSQEAELLETKLSEIPDLVTDIIMGGWGNISNLTFEIDDIGDIYVSIASDKSESAIRSTQERRRLEEERANQLLENLERINQALSEAMSWSNPYESSFLLSLNKNDSSFSITGIQNQFTQNNISDIISNNMSYILQYALNYSDSTTSDFDVFNMAYSIPTGLYLLNRIWSA